MKNYIEWYGKYLWRVVYGAIEPRYLYVDFVGFIKSGKITKYWRVSPLYELPKYTHATLSEQHQSLQFHMDDYKLSLAELSFALNVIKQLNFQGYNPPLVIPTDQR